MNKIILPILIFIGSLQGCSTSQKDLLPHGDNTMLHFWRQGSGNQATLYDMRHELRRSITSDVMTTEQIKYTRQAQNEITNLFSRLPNPDLVLYVYPHLTGSNKTPIPGYSTVFSFYRQTQYAMPGERVEEL